MIRISPASATMMTEIRSSPNSNLKLYRRRTHIDTPEINTYQRQIIFCEKKYETISKKFFIPDKDMLQQTNPYHPALDKHRFIALTKRNNRKKSLANTSSSPQNVRILQKPDPAFQENIMIMPKSKSISVVDSTDLQRCSSDRKFSMKKKHQTQYSPESKGEPEIRTALSSDQKSLRQDLESHNAFEELNYALQWEREHFQRALTTLAINKITQTTNEITLAERNSSLTSYERNIELLTVTDNQRRSLTHRDTQNFQEGDDEDKKSELSTTVTSELYKATITDENTHLQQDNDINKRKRINQLRNYLKFSGQGDPNMITTVNKQSEEEKRTFSHLVTIINKGLSGESQDRLRRKARLDYEMSLMKGESFCEQQQQAMMRTASANMENRDLQLLEEELRIFALEEIRQTNQNNKKTKESTSLGGHLRNQPSPKNIYQQNQNQSCETNGHSNKNHPTKEMETLNAEEDKMVDDNDYKSLSEERDAMSGLIPNPLTKQEMRKRILLWVYDVEEATGLCTYDATNNSSIYTYNSSTTQNNNMQADKHKGLGKLKSF